MSHSPIKWICLSALLCLVGTGCLTQANYQGNTLEAFPEEICGNRHLKTLNLAPTGIVDFPPEPLAITNPNKVSPIPECLCNLTNLRELNISGTFLSGLPDCLPKLQKLEVLDVSYNSELEIDRYGSQLQGLPALKTLNIRGCRYSKEGLEQLKQRMPEVRILHNMESRGF
ncbi:hypothetical protein [Pontibacter sp. G13]|uniref:leucine-rich repeat domain-containing protein n=1 Tax=Pontibacter sp. G13 TaxID=3074898 RepID=UPI00288B6611|nr:hypothetical protein [Pontibacter sp. G13]WNJ18778.1 hypothetical protein RJD25_28310 [Pontibacter sp. G13]